MNDKGKQNWAHTPLVGNTVARVLQSSWVTRYTTADTWDWKRRSLLPQNYSDSRRWIFKIDLET